MGKKILEQILRGLSLVRAYAGSEVPVQKNMHYFSMNPADGKMVRRKISTARRKGRKRR